MNEPPKELKTIKGKIEKHREELSNERRETNLIEYTPNYEVTTCHSREKNWIDMNKETRKYFTGRIDEELGSYIITINSNNP